MISLFATTFLRSPRHRRRLALGNRQVPSLEVGDVLHLLRCCHAVQRIAWTRTDHVPFATTLPIPTARHASQRPETRLPRTTADFRTWPRRCAPRFPAAPEIQAPIHRAEILVTLRTSALANNCPKASSRFPTSRATSSFGPAATELRPRTDFRVWRRHLTAAPPTLERRFRPTP